MIVKPVEIEEYAFKILGYTKLLTLRNIWKGEIYNTKKAMWSGRLQFNKFISCYGNMKIHYTPWRAHHGHADLKQIRTTAVLVDRNQRLM